MVSVVTLLYTILAGYAVHKLWSWVSSYVMRWRVARRATGYPGTHFIKGDLLFDTIDEYHERTLKFIADRKPKMIVVWTLFLYPFYTLVHPDTVKVILKSCNVPKDSNVNSPYVMLRPWIGEGLLAHVGGKHWERNRHLLTPAFHFDILKGYIDVFNAVADDLLEKLSRCRAASVEISGAVKVATLDALLRCAFSYEGRIQEEGFNHPYVAAIKDLSNFTIGRMTKPWLYPDFIYRRTTEGKRFYELCDYVHKFSDDIIAARKRALKSGTPATDKKHRDFLDILLLSRDEEGRGLTDLEIRAEADTFLFAGHDTTSSAISFAIYALALHPDLQERVYQEVMDVIGDRPIKGEDLGKLKYMLCFIKEVMRMYTTVPGVARILEEPTEIDGLTLPAGTPVEIHLHAMNHREDVWPDYHKFDPDRFLVEDPDRDPFTYVPFSAGNRNCIGQNFALNEQKVILSRLVQAYSIELDTSHPVEVTYSLVIQTKTGIKVFLRPRS